MGFQWPGRVIDVSDDGPTAVEFEQAIDSSTLLPGEEPSSLVVEDAIHWIRVYGELLAVKMSLLDRADQVLNEMTDDAVREINFDLRLLGAQQDRYRTRYEYWLGRAAELGGANSRGKVSTRPKLHIERGFCANHGAED